MVKVSHYYIFPHLNNQLASICPQWLVMILCVETISAILSVFCLVIKSRGPVIPSSINGDQYWNINLVHEPLSTSYKSWGQFLPLGQISVNMLYRLSKRVTWNTQFTTQRSCLGIYIISHFIVNIFFRLHKIIKIEAIIKLLSTNKKNHQGIKIV